MASHIVQLHNNLIISVLGAPMHHAPLTPPPDGPGKPPRKRRRTADEDDIASGISARLKGWTVGLGRRERERIKSLELASRDPKLGSKTFLDEIAQERGVKLLDEGRGESRGGPEI